MTTRASNALTSHDAFQTQILQEVSRSFALTIPQLPAALARPVANAYLICRITDTIEDDTGLSIEQKGHFFQAFTEVVHGKLLVEQFTEKLVPHLSDSLLPAERELVRNTPVVMQIFSELNERQQDEIRLCVKKMSEGMYKFQQIRNAEGLETLMQMNDYCYCVAGVVGEMLTGLFCDYSAKIERRRDPMMSLAASFGQGLQMTNILKDLWEDQDRGVCWFPKDIFHEAGFDLGTLRRDQNDPKFGQGLQALIGITHGHLQNALAYTLELPNNETGIRKFCIWAVGLALGTLQRINSNLDYTCAREVKVSRATSRRILMAANSSIRSNLLLKLFFRSSARGLPLEKSNLHPKRRND